MKIIKKIWNWLWEEEGLFIIFMFAMLALAFVTLASAVVVFW